MRNRGLEPQSEPAEGSVPGGLRRRSVAEQPGWCVSEYVCTSGPQDRPFEERHERASIALVTAGTFQYRTDTGRAILYPGAFLLGNAGGCFECDHEHSAGDRCIGIHVSPQLFEEVAASSGGSSKFQFPSPMLPAGRGLTSIAIGMQRLPSAAGSMAADESVLSLVEGIVATLHGGVPPRHRSRPSELRRIAAALIQVDARSVSTLSLSELAEFAAMSKYHFLRTFRRVTGTTPHQYIVATRLQRAATALVESRLPVAMIAMNAGFGDLSSFNQLFRRVMGRTPTQFRSAG
jgi:AraC family transcriptional regulator